MKLVRTTFFSAVITLIRIGSGFVAGKIVAVFTGPAGVALIGAFTNFITIILTFANGAINTGVVKYTAEFIDEENKIKRLFSTAFKISLFCSVLIGFLLIVFCCKFSELVLNTEIYKNSIRVLGFTILLYSLNSLFISILNGLGEIKTYTIVNTLGSIIGLIFTIILVYFYKVEGALYALVLSQSIVFFVTLFFIIKSPWFSISLFRQPFDAILARKLSHYSIMAIVTAITLPISQIYLRNMLTENLGIDSAGYWQGIMRISDGYLMIITTALSTYYLPKLSSLKNNIEIRGEILKGYMIVMPVVLSGCFVIYFLRHFIISLLFTDSFMQMESLFFWQLFGDFFKIAAWILAFLMLAKSMTKTYLISEILFTLIYVTSSYIFVKNFGLNGIVLAFAATYILYFFYMLAIFRKLIFSKK